MLLGHFVTAEMESRCLSEVMTHSSNLLATAFMVRRGRFSTYPKRNVRNRRWEHQSTALHHYTNMTTPPQPASRLYMTQPGSLTAPTPSSDTDLNTAGVSPAGAPTGPNLATEASNASSGGSNSSTPPTSTGVDNVQEDSSVLSYASLIEAATEAYSHLDRRIVSSHKRLPTIITTVAHLATLNTPMQVITYLLDKVITECEPQIVSIVKGYMNIDGVPVTPQSPGLSSLGDCVLKISSLYEQFKTHAAWQRLARVLAASIAALFVATKLVTTRKVSGLVKGLTGLISLNTLVGGNLFEDALYVVKTIVSALQTGTGIFEGFTDPERNSLELRYANAMALKEVFISQDWTLAFERNRVAEVVIPDFPQDDTSFYGLLDHLNYDLTLKIQTIDTKKTSADLYFYSRALAQVTALRYQVSESVKRSGFKPAAYAFGILGNSCIGKSVIVELITSTLLKATGHTDVKKLICNINSGDKYFSGLHNGHKCVILDDAVSREGLSGDAAGMEMEFIRTGVGNQPIPYVSAKIEDKGRIMPFFDLMALTTNVEYLDAHNTAKCPYSVLRRIKCMIVVQTKREYWREEKGVLVPDSLRPLRSGEISTDVYLFTVNSIIEDRGGKANGYEAKGHWEPVKHEGRPLVRITWTELLRYLVPVFKAHILDQRGKVTFMRELVDLPLCEHECPQGTCDLCRADPPLQVGVQVRPVPTSAADAEGQWQQAHATTTAFMDHLNRFGIVKDFFVMSSPWSLLDPIGGLCRTTMYWRESMRQDTADPGWIAAYIMRRAWVKTLLGHIYAILHGVLCSLSWSLILFCLFSPSLAYLTATSTVSALICGLLVFTVPWMSFLTFVVICAFSFVAGFVYFTVIIPLSLVVAVSLLVALTFLRLCIARSFVRVMSSISRLEARDAARLQGSPIFSVNMRLVSGLSALVCMFLTGKIIYQFTRKRKEVPVIPAGLFSSRPEAEPLTDPVYTGPIVYPAARPPPTERQFTTSCLPAVDRNALPSAWQRQDIYHRYPPPPEKWATSNANTIKEKLQLSTFRIELETADGERVTQTGLFVTSNFFIMNAHGLYREGKRRQFDTYSVYRDALTKARGKLWDSNWVRLERAPGDRPETVPDVVLLFLPSAPSRPSLLGLFEDRLPVETSAYVYGLNNDTKPYHFSTRVTRKQVRTDALGTLSALEYRCRSPLEVGYCGHPLLDVDNKLILGIHCAVVSADDDKYLACVVNKTPLLNAIELISSRTKTLRPLASAVLPAYGIEPHALTYGPISNNSVLLQDPDANVNVLGTVKGYIQPRYRKRFVPSRASELLVSLGLPCQHHPPEDYGKWSVDKTKISSTRDQAHIPADILLAAAEICHEEDRAVMAHVPPGSLGLLSIEDAINGVGGLGPMPRSTSAGFPFKGKKRDYLIETTRPNGDAYFLPTPELESDVRVVWATLAGGERINAIYKACHKAELVKPGKSTRVFEGIPLPFYIVMRMVFGSLYALYSAFALQLCTVGGINPFGKDWHSIYQWMSLLSHEIAGDYQRFDASGEPQEKHITMHDVIALMREFGNYDEESLDVASACAFEHIYHVGLFRGDLVEFFGPTASGCLLTLLIGNRINRQRLVAAAIVLFRRHGEPILAPTRPIPQLPVITIAGYELPATYRQHMWSFCAERNLPSVFDHMILLTMGDDFRIRVDGEALPFLNQRAIQEVFYEWDIVITDSHKNPVFADLFTSEDEIDFLKRGDRFDEELQIVRGPLLLKSIFKPYFYYQPSPAITEDLYLAGLIVVTEMELHMHGREVYDEYHFYLEVVVDRLNLGNFLSQPLQSYDDVTASWRAKYEAQDRSEGEDIPFYHVTPQAREYCLYCNADHYYRPGSEVMHAMCLLIRYRHYHRQWPFSGRVNAICRELECMFSTFNRLEADLARRIPDHYEYWAENRIPSL